MRITAVTIHDFKAIQTIKIEPAADCHLILLGGKNAQGKSSTMDGIAAALGGAKFIPSEPVRRGAANAEIEILTDTGLQILRTIQPDGSSEISVASKDGEMKSPTKMLNSLINSKFLDPLAFCTMPDKDKRDAVLAIMPNGSTVIKLDLEYERIFKDRTDINRDHKKAQAELDRLPALARAEPIDTVAIMEQSTQAQRVIASFAEASNAIAALSTRIENGDTTIAAGERAVEDLRAQLAKAEQGLVPMRAKLAALRAERDTLSAATDAQADKLKSAKTVVAESSPQLAAAERANRLAAEYAAAQDRRSRAEADVAKLAKQSAEKTDELAAIKDNKAKLLKDADLGIEGFDVDTLRINGTLWADASEAQRYIVAIRIAMRAAPEIKDIMIRNGAVLDGDALQLISDTARAHDACVWVERGSFAEAGAIVIHAGRIVGAA